MSEPVRPIEKVILEAVKDDPGLMRAYVDYLSQRKRLSRELDALLKHGPGPWKIAPCRTKPWPFTEDAP